MYIKPPIVVKSDAADQQALLAMFRDIPVAPLKETALSLLKATRTVRTSKATKMGADGVERPDTVEEPDNAVRLRTWEIIISHRAGAPAMRRPIEAAREGEEQRPCPGLLKKSHPQPIPDSASARPAD